MASKVHETITKIMIEKIEARRAAGDNIAPWRKTWNSAMGAPRNLVSDKPYRGSNLFMTMVQGHRNPYWVTAKQCAALGGTIKPGEMYTPIVYWNFPSKEERKVAELSGKRAYAFVKFYKAWNASQTDGLQSMLIEKLQAQLNRPKVDPIEACERLLKYNGRPSVQHGGDRACYAPSMDTIMMPEASDFDNAAEYYHTRFHEETHATGHSKRLAREGVVNVIRFGSHAYSAEELIAEMGASMLASHAGIGSNALADNSAAYLDAWLKVLKADPSMLIASGCAAQKAVDHIMGVTWDHKED